jgi:hypothetical protein
LVYFPFLFVECPSLSHLISVFLKSTLSEISIAAPACFRGPLHSCAFCYSKIVQPHLASPFSQAKPVISPGSLDSFYWQMVLEEKCVHCYWSVIAGSPIQQTSLGSRYFRNCKFIYLTFPILGSHRIFSWLWVLNVFSLWKTYFLKIALLVYNLYIIEITILKYTIQCFLVYSQLYNHQHNQF